MTDPVLRALIALPFGLAFGSFLTVAVHRLPKGESLMTPRSTCPSCGAQILARDNVPVVSWLLLRGRCRSCRARISALYPLTEVATAVLGVGAVLEFDRVWVAIIMALFLGLMPAVAVIDWRHKIIPNRLMYPALLAAPVLIVAARLAAGGVDLGGAGFGFLAYGGGFFVIAIISPRGMGMGDVKLAALIGLVLGAVGMKHVLVAMGLGILAGALASIGALIAGRSRKHAIPFGPFMALGAVAAAFLAPQVADLYLRTVS